MAETNTVQARDYAVPPRPVPTLAVTGSSARFPVHRIFCIGRNYAAHAVEMGGDPSREPPFFFLKPAHAICTQARMAYPPATSALHHELEMVVALQSGGRAIAPEAALTCVFGYGVGLDMTRRDLQAQAKQAGRPWDAAKGFDHSAPCGALSRAEEIGHPDTGAMRLAVNGTERQTGDLNQMVWKVPEIIATLSRAFTLEPGDLIMTGTPAGVGSVSRGDTLEAEIAGLAPLTIAVD